MLIEFRVENFRSIREIQTFSLVASTDREQAETHLQATGIKSLPYVVKSAVVYGANASGKTSLLMAMDYMRRVIAESATLIQPGQPYNVQNFKLDNSFREKPTVFEMNFMLGDIRHQYAFEMTQHRIISESLYIYRTAKPTHVFSREVRDGVDEYEFGTYLIGPKKLWQETTRPNALFLSTAAQLNSEQLSPIFKWLVTSIVYIPAQALISLHHSTALLATDAGKEKVRDFLAAADISIAEVDAVERKGINFVINTSGSSQNNQEETEFSVPVFKHISPTGSATFELHEESTGTQRLFMLAAPVLDVLRAGLVLVVDELDASLHPLLVRQLIAMFHSSELNTNRAQLIFTTHDTSLLDQSVFRRDQVWFTEKDQNQATKLYPLTDFSPRKNEALEKGYLMGRYGAVPFFKELPILLNAHIENASKFSDASRVAKNVLESI
jgi:AAA15 family ATPase/GTPase